MEVKDRKIARKDQVLIWYREAFPLAAAYIKQRGGNLEIARDLFQDAIILYYEKTQLEQFEPKVSDKAYLVGIVKKLWFRYQRNKTNTEQIDELPLVVVEDQNPATRKLLDFLKESGKKCMDLLQSFYYEKLSMQELAQRFGYNSERSATVQKYKCLEKIRNEVKHKSLTYEDFLN